MANKKQQRRRYMRAQGRGRQYDRELPERPARPAKPARTRKEKPGSRRMRVPPPPSYTRTAKRAGIWSALWFLVLELTPLGGNASPLTNIAVAVLFFVVLWGVGVLTEAFAWRRYQKRKQGGG